MTFTFFLDCIDYRSIPLVHSLIHSLIIGRNRVHLYTSAKIDEEKTDFFEVITVKKFIFNNLSPFLIFFKFLTNYRRNNIDYFIAIDPQTIIPIYLLSKIFRKKKIFISLEIYLKEDSSNIFYKYSYLCQKYFLEKFEYIIIMDEERKDLLERSICKVFSENKLVFLPNSPLGEAIYNQSKYLNKRLGLDLEKKILLNPGEITLRSFANELAEISNSLNDKYRIVLHSRRKRMNDTYISSLQSYNKITLSLDPVEIEKLDDLYSSAYIGLVLYKIAPIGITAKNLLYIGKSSGKLSYFLKNGIPVIMSDLPYFTYLENKYNCGICIENPNYLTQALGKISMDYNQFSNNAVNCFNSELNFKKYYFNNFNKILGK